jgi:hypothetical protein
MSKAACLAILLAYVTEEENRTYTGRRKGVFGQKIGKKEVFLGMLI